METTERIDIYEMVTNRIIAELENGVVPWQRTWTEAGIPQNLLTRRPYRGINIMLLSLLNYEQNYFLTFRQLKKLGGSVRKGEKGHMIVFWKVDVKEENGEKVKQFFLRYYRVFNISQCEKIPLGLIPTVIELENDPMPSCELILENMLEKPKIVHKENQPYYNPVKDVINMPKLKSFTDSVEFYLTLYHEIIHWTGHEARLHREGIMDDNYGSELYSLEELIAEMGACYLTSHAGVLREKISNSAAYMKGWLSVLKEDKKFIFHAASQAQKAVDYILGVKSHEGEAEKEEWKAEVSFVNH